MGDTGTAITPRVRVPWPASPRPRVSAHLPVPASPDGRFSLLRVCRYNAPTCYDPVDIQSLPFLWQLHCQKANRVKRAKPCLI